MTDQEKDQASAALMATSLALAEDTPQMMADSLNSIAQTLYAQLVPEGDENAVALFNGLWAQIEHIHILATSQALGVASAGLVATAYKIQRDEALQQVQELNEALRALGVLGGAP